jgi:medium-chain acyl-[acyl-carrier-protein] hydrolase
MDLLIDELTPRFLAHSDMPVAFFGHSLGALIAFELARRVEQVHGQRIGHLFVASCVPPHRRTETFPVDQLPRREFLEVLRVYNGIDDHLLADEALLNSFLPTIRADFEMARCYVYEHDDPLTCPITGFIGTSDPICSVLQMGEWCDQTSASYRCQRFAGDHFFLREHATTVVAEIAEALLG